MAYLKKVKFLIVSGVAGTLTVLSFQFSYFEVIEEGIEYGIWRGFPFGYYFSGEYMDWRTGLPSWIYFKEWDLLNFALDFIIYFIIVASTLYLIELGLKKLFKIEW